MLSIKNSSNLVLMSPTFLGNGVILYRHKYRKIKVNRRVWRYQRSNQNPYIEEGQTTQWTQDTKGVIRICISKKNRQHNGQKKKSTKGQTTTYINLPIYFNSYMLLSCDFMYLYRIVVNVSITFFLCVSLYIFFRGSYYSIFSFICMFCRSLFVLLYFFSFGHCVVCSSSIYRFWLPLHMTIACTN
jgi:hypothetical protein